MNRDELREKIASLIKGHTISMWRGLTSPEELSDQILALIAPELAKANKYDALFPLVKRIATISYNQVNGGEGLLTAREVWEWQAEAERILYGKVGGCRDALEGKEG